MESKPVNDFFHFICNSLSSFISSSPDLIDNILSTTGPFALTEIYDRYNQKEQVTLLPSSAVYPLTVAETRRAFAADIDEVMQAKIDNAQAVHYFFGSWYDNMQPDAYSTH